MSDRGTAETIRLQFKSDGTVGLRNLRAALVSHARFVAVRPPFGRPVDVPSPASGAGPG